MINLLESVKHFLEKMSRDVPVDKVQLEAAQDRLQKRTEDLKEATDALSEMIKRMTSDRRQQDKKNKRQRTRRTCKR